MSQKSPDIASPINAIAFFSSIASIVDSIFDKAKIFKIFVIFAFPKWLTIF